MFQRRQPCHRIDADGLPLPTSDEFLWLLHRCRVLMSQLRLASKEYAPDRKVNVIRVLREAVPRGPLKEHTTSQCAICLLLFPTSL